MTRDADILQFIHDYREEQGMPPSVRDVAGHLGLAKSTAHYHLHRLYEAGLVRVPGNRYRSMVVTPAGLDVMKQITSPLEQL